MPKASHSVRVQAIPGESMRYWVESWQSADTQHTVDLLEHDGNGQCSCRDFLRCLRNMKDGHKKIPYGYPGLPHPNRTQCRHIYCARMKFTADVLTEMSRRANA